MEQWIFCTVHFHLEFWTGQISVQRSSLPLRYSPSLKSPQHTDPIPGCLHRCDPAVAFPASRIELVPRAQSPALPHASTHWCFQHGGGGPEVFPLILLCALLCARRGAGTPCCPASSWAGCTCCSSGSPREPGAGTGPRKLPTPAQVRSAKAFDPRPYSCWQSELAMRDSSTLGLPRPTGGSAGSRGGAAGMLSGVGSGRGGTAGYASASRGRGGAGRSSPAVIGSAAVSPPGWCFPSAGSALRRGRGCSAGSAHAAAPRAAPAARQLPPPSLAGEFIYLFIYLLVSFPHPPPSASFPFLSFGRFPVSPTRRPPRGLPRRARSAGPCRRGRRRCCCEAPSSSSSLSSCCSPSAPRPGQPSTPTSSWWSCTAGTRRRPSGWRRITVSEGCAR